MIWFICTVTFSFILYVVWYSNIGEALISKGLARCLRHGRNDDQRSSHYDDLLTAENRAEKNKKGVHSKKESTLHRVADVSGVSYITIYMYMYMYNVQYKYS